MQNVIDVDHLSIRFNLASQKVNNLKEYAIKMARHELMFQEFLALKDVDLHIKKGEAWGLIGTNGSGKSTLLKAVTGILKPYKGSVKVRGRIAPLIELGAGFDMELTARENIFLNGAVLGHDRRYMEEHFDEIVDFAGIDKFLDSPIKNFSSGMKARLGFAVATTMEADILIVDEVLSVGDINFQKKCNERMQKLLSGGTTLLYVSHSVSSVKNLCDHALWLSRGETIMSGDADVVCDTYLNRQAQIYRIEKKEQEEKRGQDKKKFDYLVVGAGLYGAVFAREASSAGRRVLVIDRKDHVGGSCSTRMEKGTCIHENGPHIFHTDNEQVWSYVNGFAKFHPYTYSPVAVYKDQVFHIPPDMNDFNRLWGTWQPRQAREKLEVQIRQLNISTPQNLQDQALSLVGPDLYEKLVRGYMQKVWGRPCREIPASAFDMPPVRYTYDSRYYDDAFQGIPQEGYTALIAAMLEDIRVELGVDYRTYIKEHPDTFEKVVYTGSIDEYFDYQLGYLPYRSRRYELEELDTDNDQGNAVVLYTDEETPFTRIIEHRHFLPERSGTATVISREYVQEWKPGMEPYEAVGGQEAGKLYQAYRKLADEQENVIFGGRLGDYRNYSMGETIEHALAAVSSEFGRR